MPLTLREWAAELGWLGLVWLVAALAVGVWTAAAVVRVRRPSLVALHHDQAGASYSMAYVMTLPIYILFVCVVFEATLMLVAKLGTVYAAHAAARSAVVWATAQPRDRAEKRMRQSAWTAMTPVVHIRQTDGAKAPPVPGDAGPMADDFADMYAKYSARSFNDFPSPLYRKYTRNNPDPAATRANFRTAAARTEVVVEEQHKDQLTKAETWVRIRLGAAGLGDGEDPQRPLRITVTYTCPFLIPGAGRLLDPDGKYPYEYPVVTRATLPHEGAASPDNRGTLGIGYQSNAND